MDNEKFDAIVKQIAVISSRRKVIGSGIAGVSGLFALRNETNAKKKKKKDIDIVNTMDLVTAAECLHKLGVAAKTANYVALGVAMGSFECLSTLLAGAGQGFALQQCMVTYPYSICKNCLGFSCDVLVCTESTQPRSGEVLLYQSIDFGGKCQRFNTSIPDLSDEPIGNNTVSSMKVGHDIRGGLYSAVDYRGDSTTIGPWKVWSNLASSNVGDNTASSLRITRSSTTPTTGAPRLRSATRERKKK